MAGYRDRTFCIARCKTTRCDRKLTEQVRRDAREWWGGDGAPIGQANFSSRCEDYQPEDAQ